MSRIAGLWNSTREAQASQVRAMLEALRYKPHWHLETAVASRGALGCCGWSKPNISTSQDIIAVVDGVFYNRHELGVGNNDADRLIALYRQHGMEQALRQINGDFAVALYDVNQDKLWLAVDRFGVRPLYYAKWESGFAFASQPRALLTLPGVRRDVNREFVALYAGAHYRYHDNDMGASPYAAISRVPLATALCIHESELESVQYWSLEEKPDFTASFEHLAEEYQALLEDAVALRLRTVERPAFTLSGGMDSSSVLASAVKTSGQRQHAFSTVYDDKTYDESDDITTMLASAVEEWHPVTVGNPDVFSLLREIIAVHDQPVVTATWLSHYLLCQEAQRRGFGSLFGGLGGDELNAGEYEHFLYFFADLRADGDEARLKREVEYWALYHDHPIFRKNYAVMEESLSRIVDFSQPGRSLPDNRRLLRYAHTLNPDYFDLHQFVPTLEHPFRSYLKNRTYQDLTRETIPPCLRAEDRQTVAFELDNVVPFLDHRLVEFMYRVPSALKYQDGVSKHLLREAMKGVLAEETRTRIKKTGWNAPAHQWFSGAGREPLLDLIHSQTFRNRGIYNISVVEALIDEHERIVSSGSLEENHMMFLWQLVNLELWLQGL